MNKLTIDNHTILMPLSLSDTEEIFNTIDSQREDLGKWLPFVEYMKTLYDEENYVKSQLSLPEDKREPVFVVRHDGTFAGLIGFLNTEKENKRTEIGYWLSVPFRKKGIITKSVTALCNLMFDKEHDMNRIQIRCAKNNFSSKNIPIKLGFKHEGTERQGQLLSDGNYTDIEIYSILRNEWLDNTNNHNH